MLGRSLLPVGFGATLVLLAASTTRAHTLTAQGATTCTDPCAVTHLEGQYTDNHVPGVDLDYSFFNTMVDSDFGASSIDAGLSWFEGSSRPGANFELINTEITENVVLTRSAPGSVSVRATMLFSPVAQITGPGHSAVTVTGTLSFDGCQVVAHQTFSIIGPGNLDAAGASTPGCEARADFSALTVTRTYDDALPTNSQLSASLVSDYLSIQKNSSIGVQAESHLYQLELSNATADWDTPTFLALAPEPEADGLAGVALSAVAAVGASRRFVAAHYDSGTTSDSSAPMLEMGVTVS